MKKSIVILFGILIICMICFYLLEVSKSSIIDNYNMNIDVNVDGSVNVKEIKDYNFINNDSTIILDFSVIGKNNFLDKFNTFSFKNNIEYFNIKVEQDGKIKEMKYKKNNYKDENNNAMLDNVVLSSDNMFGIKVNGYFHKGIAHVTFEYLLDKAIARYSDKTQIYLNISDVSNRYDINNMKINLNVNNKAENSNISTYEYNKNDIAVSQTSSKNYVFNYDTIKAGSAVQARILYDSVSNSAIPFDSAYIVDKIQNDTTKHQELKQIAGLLQKSTIGLAILMFIYWIYLLMKYDFNKLDSTSFPSYEEIVDSINPIVAACIIDERNKLEYKDLIGCLVGLSAKNIINLTTLPRELYEEKLKVCDDKNNEEIQEYIASLKDENLVFLFEKNKKYWADTKNVQSLDEIERQTVELFFGKEEEFVLDIRLYEIKNDLLAQLKIKGINNSLEEELDKLGANMPMKLSTKILNKVMFVLIMIFLIAQVIFNIYYSNVTHEIFTNYTFGITHSINNLVVYMQLIIKSLIVAAAIAAFLQVIVYFSYFVILFLNQTTKLTLKYIKQENSNFNAKIYMNSISKVTKMASKILAICIFIAVIIFLVLPTNIVFINMLLFTFALIIVVTDDYMYKHSVKLSKLYLGINILQNKIAYGSLLKQKDLKDSIVWNKYLAFSLAFGISNISDYTNILKEKSNTSNEVKEYITNTKLYIDLLESFLEGGSETASYARRTSYINFTSLFNKK